jgi:hypothetical protein
MELLEFLFTVGVGIYREAWRGGWNDSYANLSIMID